MKTLFSIICGLVLSTSALAGTVVDDNFSTVPAGLSSMKESLSPGKSGIVCSIAGLRVSFEIYDQYVKFVDWNDQSHATVLNLEGFVVNPTNGNEELKGSNNKYEKHTVVVSQMETGISVTIQVDFKNDFIETKLDSRLCR